MQSSSHSFNPLKAPQSLFVAAGQVNGGVQLHNGQNPSAPAAEFSAGQQYDQPDVVASTSAYVQPPAGLGPLPPFAQAPFGSPSLQDLNSDNAAGQDLDQQSLPSANTFALDQVHHDVLSHPGLSSEDDGAHNQIGSFGTLGHLEAHGFQGSHGHGHLDTHIPFGQHGNHATDEHHDDISDDAKDDGHDDAHENGGHDTQGDNDDGYDHDQHLNNQAHSTLMNDEELDYYDQPSIDALLSMLPQANPGDDASEMELKIQLEAGQFQVSQDPKSNEAQKNSPNDYMDDSLA